MLVRMKMNRTSVLAKIAKNNSLEHPINIVCMLALRGASRLWKGIGAASLRLQR